MNNTSVKSKSKDNGRVIKGMNRDTALRYVEARKKMDTKLCQIMALGAVINSLGESDIDLIHVAYTGQTIEEIAGEIYGMLDEFIPSISVESELKETDKNMDKA